MTFIQLEPSSCLLLLLKINYFTTLSLTGYSTVVYDTSLDDISRHSELMVLVMTQFIPAHSRDYLHLSALCKSIYASVSVVHL